ncbi:hypothetical protein PR202_ga31589 [Eleusine coracana subsp. coracana]|uniref:protein-serine/threonine phosphatase n=1 Tax=Eleusine coracana subsp. coracana TaxID=191504 RepID=A0AAV5DRD0_ELECO|nr:hypothetical protein PR202_ga31589 [Eleusine coracana subsp. coracana]
MRANTSRERELVPDKRPPPSCGIKPDHPEGGADRKKKQQENTQQGTAERDRELMRYYRSTSTVLLRKPNASPTAIIIKSKPRLAPPLSPTAFLSRLDPIGDGTEQGMSSSSAAAAGAQHQHQHRRHGGGSGLVPLAALIKEESRTERRAAAGSRICARDEDAGAGAGVAEEARRQRPLLRYGVRRAVQEGRGLLPAQDGLPASFHLRFLLCRLAAPHLRRIRYLTALVLCLGPSAWEYDLINLNYALDCGVAGLEQNVLDGHNGNAAAIYTRDNLLNHVLSAMPRGLSREEWLHALPRALVAGRERVTASGGEVGRLSVVGGAEIGPLRCWPGGLCLSRSIGDIDVGEFIVPVPYVKQVKLSNAGGRLIIASDGIWDALSSEAAAKCCRGLPAELAAKQVVKEALRTRGLKDDTTCIVVDLIPPGQTIRPPSPPRKMNKFMSLIFRKKAKDPSPKLTKQHSTVGIVEEIFEEGSAMLSERNEVLLGNDSNGGRTSSTLFTCAICQVDLEPSEGISVHAGSIFSSSSKPWEGPFLCLDCRDKKDAMEGKRPSGAKVTCPSYYTEKLQSYSDGLADLIYAATKPTLVLTLFCGLSAPLCSMGSIIKTRDPLPTFSDTCSILALEEADLKFS